MTTTKEKVARIKAELKRRAQKAGYSTVEGVAGKGKTLKGIVDE